MPDVMSSEALAPLVRNTIFSGNVHHHDQVESTNALALAAAASASTARLRAGEVFDRPEPVRLPTSRTSSP